MYKTELDAMVANDNGKLALNFKPYVITAMDNTMEDVTHPIWAKTVYDAFQQCLLQFPTDIPKAIYSLDDPDNLNAS